MLLKTISPHPSTSKPSIEGFIKISPAKNLSGPILIFDPSGSTYSLNLIKTTFHEHMFPKPTFYQLPHLLIQNKIFI